VGSEGIEAPAASRRFGTSFAGGWGGTLLAGVVLLVLAGALTWLGLSGRLADLRHANLPFHPYLPAGYALNPFNPGNRDDLINMADANKVRADFTSDGQMEIDALSTLNRDLLGPSTSGNFLAKLQSSLAANQAAGILEQEQDHRDSIVVGRLMDPSNPNAQWCAEEKGTGAVNYVSVSTHQTIRSKSFRFVSRFWLIRVGDRYLITDAQISSVPTT
jgi:hypothetical protein